MNSLRVALIRCSGSDRVALLIIMSLNPINIYFQPLEGCFFPQKVDCKKRHALLLNRIPLTV